MAFLGLIPEPKSAVQLRLTPAQVQREATGRALALMGGTISAVGGLMILSVNPTMQQEASGIWKRLPKPLQQNKAVTAMGAGLLVAGLIVYGVRRTNKARYSN